MKVAIIGSAREKLTEAQYSKMILRSEEELKKLDTKIDLVSGGSSWCDQVAVVLFLKSKEPDYPIKIKSLTLHLPTYWDRANNKFYDSYCGDILNKLHHEFSEELYQAGPRTTLQQIGLAVSVGAKTIGCYDGFYERNIEVGKVDLLLAFTFSTLNIPCSKGTLHTWENSSAPQKIHVSLSSL